MIFCNGLEVDTSSKVEFFRDGGLLLLRFENLFEEYDLYISKLLGTLTMHFPIIENVRTEAGTIRC